MNSRTSKLTLIQGDFSKLKSNKEYHGVWSGVDVRWKLPSGLYVAKSSFQLGGWNVPCRITLNEKGLKVHAEKTGPDEM